MNLKKRELLIILPFVLILGLFASFVISDHSSSKGLTSRLTLSSSSSSSSLLVNNEANQRMISRISDVKLETKIRRPSNLELIEAGLAKSRALIKRGAGGNQTIDDHDYVPSGSVYWNPNTFHRSYLEMEKKFKIYVYKEGDPPVFHDAPCDGILGIEGIFINDMEISRFRTLDPEKAHVFFLPISIVSIVHFVYVRETRLWSDMKNTAIDYVDVIAEKHPYWNRSLGADHFMLACHDWGPEISTAIPILYKNSIRALCNANTSEGFNLTRDVSIPEIYLPHGTTEGLLGGPSPSKRTILVFFSGGIHGYIRQVLLEHWENKTEDGVKIQQYLPKGENYYDMVRKSKYCICASGWEVASPRMVEALYMGCVPVLIKDHYAKPFSDVLDWRKFSIDIALNDIPNLKIILMGISQRQYIRFQRNGVKVRKHFVVNLPPKRYDVFHMILHSIWLRRLNTRIHDP
ncbi:probable glycosyltransferase At5g03795 isoform X2 [Cynara cardunculus var. scolymus]|uniref:probable glycosyltransferase At5g03795 isoform X2 n=1 Tax=Cynara cardunculus var. scolymus TaxID=59895 RepID=UPI000D627C27|nr:probable glycosyltransferase At5g03795 isoform X2 [Cynara cardunculus var. scolymus]